MERKFKLNPKNEQSQTLTVKKLKKKKKKKIQD